MTVTEQIHFLGVVTGVWGCGVIDNFQICQLFRVAKVSGIPEELLGTIVLCRVIAPQRLCSWEDTVAARKLPPPDPSLSSRNGATPTFSKPW